MVGFSLKRETCHSSDVEAVATTKGVGLSLKRDPSRSSETPLAQARPLSLKRDSGTILGNIKTHVLSGFPSSGANGKPSGSSNRNILQPTYLGAFGMANQGEASLAQAMILSLKRGSYSLDMSKTSLFSPRRANSRSGENPSLECDSTLVVDFFNEKSNAPCKLQNEEGNSCADKLASSGITSKRNSTWKSLPSFISIAYNRNRFGLPNYRFDNL
ncbi:hypothetical protein Lal_00014351 [Lupinus albus]|nr:hypothetical protein Lal_00014351 [Lupinus albus]